MSAFGCINENWFNLFHEMIFSMKFRTAASVKQVRAKFVLKQCLLDELEILERK